jgi:hypothetical protein
MPNEDAMNNTLPSDIQGFMAAAAQQFRAAMAAPPMWRQQPPLPETMTREQYELAAIAGSGAADEPGYSVEETK